ncbi:hypothetical protein BDU57DRAFT_92266 [Ampelomyces quisqualis]|uniref:Uncharacterized protein n=1 Tax=Ampelomyces quisqualis TaxID=50730 RepID=A0A6A5Q7P4_AMPQU|nr:hypothetical protein BDU57DRAFT_92266 [Ampelomyces quisqualis]
MKFTSIILAGTGLLGLVGATATVNNVATSSLSLFNIEVRVDDNSGVAHAPPSQCYLNCHLPWEKCKKECGGTEKCGHLCNCQLFSDPEQTCRACSCVEGPNNCKLEGVKQLHETAVQARAEGNDDVQTTWLPTSCNDCQLARDTCKQNCATAGACDDACDRYHKLKKLDCKDCKIPCVCGNTCPRFEPLQRRMVVDEATMVDEAHPGSIVSNRAEADVQTAGVAPLPVPCILCLAARNMCKQRCATPGACDDACDCSNKFNNRNCKDCKIPCGCGHTCPRLEPLQSRIVIDEATDKSTHESRSNSSEQPDPGAIKGPDTALSVPSPIGGCVQCALSIGNCQNKCATPGACDDACNCYFLKSKACKKCGIPCDCGHTCPRLALVQRREITELPSTEDIQHSETVPSTGAAGIPNPCVVCRTGIQACKNKCNGDSKCENNCDCSHKNFTPQCKECSIPCNSLVPRQDGPSDAKGEDVTSTTNNEAPEQFGEFLPPLDDCMRFAWDCKKACPTPRACDDACNCYYRRKPMCHQWGHKLPCDCGHTCPRLAPAQRRDDI